jgi:hypothetical protein
MPRSTSTYAEEGTLAHEICAALVDLGLGKITHEQYDAIDKEAREHELWDDDIYTHANSYRDYISANLLSSDTIFADTELTKLSLEPWVPKAFGTADFVCFNGAVLDVCDFKYGKGVAVSPEENPQLMLYALGVLARYDLTKADIQVVLHIVQPRIGEPQSWATSSKELLTWADTIVTPRAALAARGEGDYQPSSDTCRFCRAKPICKGLAANIFATVKPQQSLDTMSLEEVAQALKQASVLKMWLQSMEDYIKDALLRGQAVRGYKLVEGKANRKICDTRKAAQLLRQAGYPDEVTHKLTLLGITDLEKLIGKKQLPDVLGDTLVKPVGQPTMVEESDPRQPLALHEATLAAFDRVTL